MISEIMASCPTQPTRRSAISRSGSSCSAKTWNAYQASRVEAAGGQYLSDFMLL